jgi:hypothetical protein
MDAQTLKTSIVAQTPEALHRRHGGLTNSPLAPQSTSGAERVNYGPEDFVDELVRLLDGPAIEPPPTRKT